MLFSLSKELPLRLSSFISIGVLDVLGGVEFHCDVLVCIAFLTMEEEAKGQNHGVSN